VLRLTFRDIALPYIHLLYDIWNKHLAQKDRSPLIRGMKIVRYPAMYHVPPLYKEKCVSRPTFSNVALLYIHPYFIISVINIGLGNIEDP
jgi:hypothetical protein